jgi:oligopeptide transport system substrate-binding protein
MKKHIWLILVVAIMLAAAMWALGACGGGGGGTDTGDEDAVEGGTLVYEIATPSFIEPTQTFESSGVDIVSAVFDSLTQFDPKTNELLPDVATSWEPNEDNSVWTFHLKKGTTFHNGREVVAGDFKYAWERMADPANTSGIAYHLAPIKGFDEMQGGTATELSGVKVIDDYTLEVTLNYPYGDFPYVVGHPCLAPLPKEEVDKDPAAFALMPVGNGPFKMAEPWVADQYVKVVKYADYKGTQPHIDGIEFKIFAEVETAYMEFQAGNVDFLRIPSGQLSAAQAQYGISDDGFTTNPGKQVITGSELAIYYMDLNCEKPPFDNVLVRQAVSLAINRQAICDAVYEGSRVPADAFIPPAIPGYVAGAWPYSKYDVEAAKAKLTEAGYPNGEGLAKITLQYNTGGSHQQVMEFIQADLAAIGITAELEAVEPDTHWAKLKEGDYTFGRAGWIADYPIADNFCYPEFYSTSGDNYAQYTNLEVDAAMDAARKIADVDKRVEAWSAVSAIIGEDCPVVPICPYAHLNIGSARLHNFVYGACGISDFVSCWLEAPAQ